MASQYGSNFDNEMGYGAFETPGPVMEHPNKDKLFLRLPRRRMNFIPMVIGCLAPWAMFTVVCAMLSFSFHYKEPTLCYLCVGLCGFFVFCVGVSALSNRFRLFGASTEREPSWMVFLTLALLLAFIAGAGVGMENYQKNTSPYYDLQNLNNYTNVYPNRMQGAQLMDAGLVKFAKGTRLDIAKSMGFKNSQEYCVAPIVFEARPMDTYDFWAIGKGCCSGTQANFHCGAYNNPLANGGIRLMRSGDRAFYRLAVQQAEATYNIKANHPLFFHWEAEPTLKVTRWISDGQSTFIIWMMSYLVFSIFAVAMASVVFSKIGAF
eukprot:TRINITY_DN47933_c0_g1_i1.p1 TRINITY_DN47933_c0_g1~~TRINITY_DN47933_c0_g1_i1.p1  ORF type:complete len:345 (-),score=47.30 TRINITY_DN47933_c0_g1_i1:114-1076(-)